MKRVLSVKAITSDWCSWVADWWQAAKRRRRRSSACQLKEQLVCTRVCVHCTDKRNWQLTAGGRGWGLRVCARVCARVSFLTCVDILTMLMRRRQRTIVEFRVDSAVPRWHAEQRLSLTRMLLLTRHTHAHKYKQTAPGISFSALVCHPSLEVSLFSSLLSYEVLQIACLFLLKYSTQTVNSCLTCGTLVLSVPARHF